MSKRLPDEQPVQALVAVQAALAVALLDFGDLDLQHSSSLPGRLLLLLLLVASAAAAAASEGGLRLSKTTFRGLPRSTVPLNSQASRTWGPPLDLRQRTGRDEVWAAPGG